MLEPTAVCITGRRAQTTLNSPTWKYSIKPVFSYIRLLFEDTIGKREAPYAFRSSIVLHIPKKAKLPFRSENWRPIHLIAAVGKLYAKVLLPIIVSTIEDHLSPLQYSYSRGLSTEMALRITLDTLRKSRTSIMANFDLSRAFERVDCFNASGTLQQGQLNPRIIDATCKIANRRSFRNKTRQPPRRARSRPTTTRRGVHQGSSQGPILFLIEVDSLPKLLTSSGVKATMYIGDLALLFNWLDSYSEEDMRNKVQNAILLVENWCNAHYFIIHTDKCSYTVFGSVATTTFSFWVNSKHINHDDNPKYLGIRICRNYNVSLHVDHLVDAINAKRSVYT